MNENPYRLIEAGPPGAIGWKILYFPQLDSTQNLAVRLAAEDQPAGTVIVAETQTAGRGRMGRKWHSPAGLNLYFTVLLRPAIAISQAPAISLVAGVAVAQALSEFAPGLPRLKWPNDLWLNERKAGGIIAEAMTTAASPHPCIALGVGLNLNQGLEQIPEAIEAIATSLAIETGARYDRGLILAAVLRRLSLLMEQMAVGGFPAIAPQWESFSALTGRQVSVSQASRQVSGVVTGIDLDGALLIDTAQGRKRVVAGEIKLGGVRMA